MLTSRRYAGRVSRGHTIKHDQACEESRERMEDSRMERIVKRNAEKVTIN